MNPMSHLWQSTLCAGVAALLVLAFKRAPARTRYNLWLAASIKFLIPLGILTEAGRYAATSFSTITPGAPASGALRWLSVAADPAASGLTFGLERTVLLALLAVWAAGAVALTVWRWREWAALSRIIRRATPLEQGREADALLHAPRSSAHARSIALLRSPALMEPGVVGPFRPRLLWPEGLSERLSDAELHAIVAHEAAHVDRRDNLTSLLHTMVETIFWFNPVVWWVGAQLVSERERACDEAVISATDDCHSYAEGILKVCGFCLRSPAAFVAGVGSSNLHARIEHILNRPRILPLSLMGRLGLAVVMFGMIGVPIAAGTIAHQQDRVQKVYTPREEGVQPPRILSEVKPVYTPEAMQAKIQGLIRMEAIVQKDGTVGDVTIVESLDKEYGLDNQAVIAIKQWLFQPGTKDGEPVNVRVEVEMTFTLR